MSRSLTLCDLEIMDTNKDDQVDKAEFLTYMLVALQKVSQDDVDEIMALFYKFDKTRNDTLTRHDLVVDWQRVRASILQDADIESA